MRKMKFFIFFSFLIILLGYTHCNPCTNFSEKVENFWKTNVSVQFGLCDKLYNIREELNNTYMGNTLEIEKNNNQSAQLCEAKFKFDDQCYVITLTHFHCSGIKRNGQGKLVLSVLWENEITVNYTQSCLVEKIGIYNNGSSIWDKVFNDTVGDCLKGLWLMGIELKDPAENSTNIFDNINETLETKPCPLVYRTAIYFDEFTNKDLHVQRYFCNATNV